jgi:metal-responsive CopG/Arc/MetJ family transcriptional regulator
MIANIMNSMDKPESKIVKTTINIDEDLWKKFSIKVIEEYGGRKKNDVIEELIKKYLKEKQ